MTDDYTTSRYAQALAVIDALLAGGPGQPTNWAPRRADAGTADDRYSRERVADLRLVRAMLYGGQSDYQVLDQLAALCPCSLDPEADGPQQDCPIHGDGQSFVDLCRWRDRVVGGAHALLGEATGTPGSGVAYVGEQQLARMRELLDAGPWASPMPDGPPVSWREVITTYVEHVDSGGHWAGGQLDALVALVPGLAERMTRRAGAMHDPDGEPG